jgi:hypothetical protein
MLSAQRIKRRAGKRENHVQEKKQYFVATKTWRQDSDERKLTYAPMKLLAWEITFKNYCTEE